MFSLLSISSRLLQLPHAIDEKDTKTRVSVTILFSLSTFTIPFPARRMMDNNAAGQKNLQN